MSRAKDDADTLIAAETLDLVCMKDVVVLAEDADIKVMLLYFVNSKMTQIIISSYLSSTVLDKHIAQYLLVIHVLSECDSTSAIYDLGKP